MANTLTDLVVEMHTALDVVSRELTGFIPAVTIDPQASRAAKDQVVRSFIAPAATASDVTPAVTPPDDGDQTFANKSITISKVRRVPFRWNGEQSLAMDNGGPGVNNMKNAQLSQAIRTLVNEVESDLAALHIYASRAYGTAGTTPFATAGDYTDASFVAKILNDNGAPGDRHLVLDTAAGATLAGKQAAANLQGDASMLRQGVLLDHSGFALRQSGAVKSHTAGTGASATTDNAGYAVGATVITLASAGTGTILAGDVITFANHDAKYLVVSGDADVSNGGTITLAAPGLVEALPTSAQAITVSADSTRSMGFSRDAIALATRLPALPDGRDMATDREMIVDPRSGLVLELAEYAQYRQIQYEVSLAWGVVLNKPEHAAVLLG